MYKNNLPSAEYLRCVFQYDENTGHLYWQNPTHPNCSSGAIKPRKDGYVWVCLAGKNYAAHRIIWVMQTGSIPDSMEVDHINHVRSDNRWVNLQLLTPIENQRKKPTEYKTRPLDQRKPRKRKFKQYPSGRWAALEWDHIAQKYNTIGVFNTRGQAEAA